MYRTLMPAAGAAITLNDYPGLPKLVNMILKGKAVQSSWSALGSLVCLLLALVTRQTLVARRGRI